METQYPIKPIDVSFASAWQEIKVSFQKKAQRFIEWIIYICVCLET